MVSRVLWVVASKELDGFKAILIAIATLLLGYSCYGISRLLLWCYW